MAVSIQPEVADVLRRSATEGGLLKLPGEQLPRPLYAATDNVLKALGGKWDRRAGGHVFPFDIGDKLAEALGTGSVVSRQQMLQHFDTPVELARRLVAMLGVQPCDRCLEPSAGRGRIVAALAEREPVRIVAVEIDPDNVKALIQQGLASDIFEKNFLDFDPAFGAYTVVAMNPPFRGNQDIRHVLRAFRVLAPGGRLAAIVSEHGFIGQEREAVEWREWLASLGAEIEQIPAGVFKESGTSIAVRMIFVRKPA